MDFDYLKHKRILLVDDEQELLDILKFPSAFGMTEDVCIKITPTFL